MAWIKILLGLLTSSEVELMETPHRSGYLYRQLLTSSEVELMETVNELCPLREYQFHIF